MKRKITLNPNIFVIHRKAAEPEESIDNATIPATAESEITEPAETSQANSIPPWHREPVQRREIRQHEPTAFCHNCQEMTPMVWLPKEERGKNCDTWFKCEFCGGRHLTIKYITEKEAVAKNKLAKEAEDL